MSRAIRESGKHLAAFELWYALGADRNLSEVARRFKTSPQAVQQWSAAFRWQERLGARERLVAGLIAEKAIEDEVRSRTDALKICRAIEIRFAEALKLGTAVITAGDFEKAVKLELLLRGKADSRTELVAGPIFDRFIELLSAVIEREVPDAAMRARLALGFQEAASGIGAAPPVIQ